MNSIRINLLKWLIVPLLIVNLVGAGLSYWLAWIPAQIAFDQSLADAGWAILPRLQEKNGQVEINLSQQAEQVLRVDHFDAIYLAVRRDDGKLLVGDDDFPALPQQIARDEPLSYDGVMRGEPVRIVAMQTLVGSRPVFIGVAETLRKRNHIRSVILFALTMLEALLALMLIAAIWIAVSKGLLPLNKMQLDLNRRTHDDLSPLQEQNVPLELAPVVRAINGLLRKVQIGATGQQNFLANVAHQLRTPLAGFRTQLEWLMRRYAGEPETAHSVQLMSGSTERMIRQTNQLLALARAEPSRFEKDRLKTVDLAALVAESIQYFVEEADKKRIDIGFELAPTPVMGDPFLLRDLIDNLIDNAIRYSPPDSAVNVRVAQTDAGGVFSVEDAGPGIDAPEQTLIFNRFYRIDDNIAGNGLGLAIVHDIVMDHGAAISVQPGATAGTVFTVAFPRCQDFVRSASGV